jgi:hypothetical protein
MKVDAKQQLDVDRDEFDAVVERATAGCPKALRELRHLLKRNPAIYERLGDLSQHVQLCLVALVAADSVLAQESLRLNVRDFRCRLGDPHDDPLQQLLINQVITTWLDVNFQQIGFSQPRESRADTKHWQWQLDRAQKRHLAALKTLAEVRKFSEE